MDQPRPNNTLKIVLISFGALLLLCCGGGALLLWGGVRGYQGLGREVVSAGNEAVHAVCSTWNLQALRERSNPDLTISPTTLEPEMQFLYWRSQYGRYQSGFGKMTSLSTQSGTSGKWARASYQNDIRCEKANLRITISYLREDSSPWKITAFNVEKR